VLVAQLVACVHRLAPPELAEDWDNVGLIVGRHNQPVRRVLVALELRDEVLDEARDRECDAVVTHHPPIFPSIASVTDDAPPAELVLRAAEARVSVIAAHTNLDAAAGGLNDLMAEALGIVDAAPLVPAPSDPGAGLGRIGTSAERTLQQVAADAARAFTTRAVFSGDAFARVRRLACCTGSGASMVGDARAGGADAYVTSDLKYHDADRAGGMPLVHVPHAAVEGAVLKRWTRSLGRALAEEGVETGFAETDTDPWQVA
jgi:dinuclear metal center YbgI/SA1388 family protein